jgi:hypothetical protein
MYRLHVNYVFIYLFEIFPSLLWVGSNCFRFSMRFTFTSQSGLDLQVGCPRYLLRTLLSSQPQIWIFSTKKKITNETCRESLYHTKIYMYYNPKRKPE